MIPEKFQNLNFDAVIPKEVFFEFLGKHNTLLINLIKHIYFSSDLSSEEWKILDEMGFANKVRFTQNDIIDLLKRKQSQAVSKRQEFTEKICSWCRGSSYILHAHHFPKKKSDGGDATIDICASCHSEYHFLESGFYVLSENIMKLFGRN